MADKCSPNTGTLQNSVLKPWDEALRKIDDFFRDHTILDYCIKQFFVCLHPTIPILNHEFIEELKAEAAEPDAVESRCVLAAMCAQVILQTEDPDGFIYRSILPDRNGGYGRALFEAALSTHRGSQRQGSSTFKQCLLSFFLYACQVRLSHHSQAFISLRESTTHLLLLRLKDETQKWQLLIDRLYWVLLISERSHAIRYRRPATLILSPSTPPIDFADGSLEGFRALADLFKPIDTTFIAFLNEEIVFQVPGTDTLEKVETAINTAINPATVLKDSQKANLRITQRWLRIIIWQLRVRLGHLTGSSIQQSLTFQYPLLVARDLVLCTKNLPISCIEVHGVGVTEKIFDVASAVIDVLAPVPFRAINGNDDIPDEDIRYLRQLIRKLPGGIEVYDRLLAQHIEETIPGFFEKLIDSEQDGDEITNDTP